MRTAFVFLLISILSFGCFSTREIKTPIPIEELRPAKDLPFEKKIIYVQIGKGLLGVAEEVTVYMDGQIVRINSNGVFVTPSER